MLCAFKSSVKRIPVKSIADEHELHGPNHLSKFVTPKAIELANTKVSKVYQATIYSHQLRNSPCQLHTFCLYITIALYICPYDKCVYIKEQACWGTHRLV